MLIEKKSIYLQHVKFFSQMSEIETTRNIDSLIEKEINAFNARHLYGKDILFKRENDRSKQLQGIDGYISVPELGIIDAPCDEKASGQYVNNALPTFLMELSQVTLGGNIVDGWFLDEKNQSEYYMLMYLWAGVPQTVVNGKLKAEWKEIKRNNISLVEFYLVEKKKLQEYIKECGFDGERLKKGANYLREHMELDEVPTKYGFKFKISRKLRECPVNLCIDRQVYNKICTMHGYANKFD